MGLIVALDHVRLNEKEFIHAAFAGFYRQAWATLRNLRDPYAAIGRDSWAAHIQGAVAEFACAKHFGLFWSGPGELGQVDVGGCLQVRSITKRHYRMPVYEDDRDEQVFVLMVPGATILEWHFRGWIYGRDAKRPEWWDKTTDNPKSAGYYVPQGELNTSEPPIVAPESEHDARWRDRHWP